MIPTDKERREVARRLRELRMTAPGVTSVGHGYLWSLLWAVSGDELGGSSRLDWFERMCSRLADLIEPSIPADPGEAGLACVDAFIREHTEKPVDRDALLELADDMDAYTKCDDERCGEMMPPKDIHDYARRIREALGVCCED